MTNRRIQEAGTIKFDASANKFRVCLITEGQGTSAMYPREFFTQETADALAGSLSFSNHPIDPWHPEHRDPMTAIGQVGETVTVEADPETGEYGLWGDYFAAKSRPEVGPYLSEFVSKLGLSIYADSYGYEDTETGGWVATGINPRDPFKSVDLVVAAGRGGKFDRMAEGLKRIQEASATAEENKETKMDKDIEERFSALSKLVESLVTIVTGEANANAQAEVDSTAVKTAVESRLSEYDKAVDLITEAKLTESQSQSLRALAKEGVEIAPHLESAKKVLAEARASEWASDQHLGGGGAGSVGVRDVPGFGRVVS